MNNQKEEFNPILQNEQNNKGPGNSLHSLKLDYLIKQKHKLEVQMNQLALNNKLLREINYNISKQHNIDLKCLAKRNSELESMLEKMFNQNKQLRANIFVNSQVNLQNQSQQKDIFENYENKIKELRFLIQVKQTNIQSLESLISNKKWVVPTNNNVQYFQSCEDIKQSLKECKKNNIELLAENSKIRKELGKLTQQLQKISMLVTSKCTFLEYRNLIGQKRPKSTPKSRINIQSVGFNKFQIKPRKQGLQSTCQSKFTSKKNVDLTVYGGNSFQNQNENHFKVVKLDQIIRIKNYQIERLNQSIDAMRKKTQALNFQKKKLVQSNNLHHESRIKLVKKANYYQQMTKVLFNYLTQRVFHKQSLDLSNQDDLTVQTMRTKKILGKISHKPQVVRVEKQFWISLKKSLDENLKNLQTFQKKKRSFSCVLDYILIEPGQEEIEKRKGIQEQFSMCLDDSKFGGNDIEFIGGKGIKDKKMAKSKGFEQFSGGLFEDIDLDI